MTQANIDKLAQLFPNCVAEARDANGMVKRSIDFDQLRLELSGKAVYFVDGNALAACFEEGISEEFVKLLAKREPLRAVFRDSGFASDSVKINVEQIFKLMSPGTEVKTI